MEKNIKKHIISNPKLSFYMNKWNNIEQKNINLNKYQYIYDYQQKIFGKNNQYQLCNEVYYFEFQNSDDFVLVGIPKRIHDIILSNVKDKWIFYNIYNTHYNGSKQLVTYYDMEKKISNINKNNKVINWIWFRKPNFKLNTIVFKRVFTWFDSNPDFSFIFWTNMKDITELSDFLSECDKNLVKIFLEKTNIKYNENILQIVNNFYRKNLLNIKNIDIFLKIYNSNNKHDIIYKTDYLRYIIIYEYGGIYVDFNDCICLEPIKYVLHFHEKELLFAKDSGIKTKIDYNNYFIYSNVNNQNLLEYIKKSLGFFPEIYNFITDKLFIKKQIEIFYNILSDIKESKSINYINYKKKLLEEFLLLTYFSIEIKDNLVQFILKNDIIQKILDKYLNYIIEYEENIINIIDDIKNNVPIRNEINIDFVKEFFEYHYENFIGDYIFINTTIYVHFIINVINIPLFCKTYLNINVNTIDNCYLLKHMSYLSFIGHLYDNTCFGNEKKYDIIDDIIP